MGTGTGGTARVLSKPRPAPPRSAPRHRLLAAADGATRAPLQPLSGRPTRAARRSSPAVASVHGALSPEWTGHGGPEGGAAGAFGAPCRAKAEQR